MNNRKPLLHSGSFKPDDVIFLLHFLEPDCLGQIFDAEGEVVLEEAPASPSYQHYFHLALDKYAGRLAKDIIVLAAQILLADACNYTGKNQSQESYQEGLVIASLARAGTPLGVLLARTLRQINVPCRHYSIGLCPVTGVDSAALDHILKAYRPEQLIFFDGWTAKGAVYKTLSQSLSEYNRKGEVTIEPRLYCLSDLASVCTGCATQEDYLIPSSLLNATVCGLVSRTFTVAPEQYLPDRINAFHNAFYFQQLEKFDLSQFFVEFIWTEIRKLLGGEWRQNLGQAMTLHQEYRREYRQGENPGYRTATFNAKDTSADFLAVLCRKYDESPASIKPGITEATRAMLRRNCRALVVKNRTNPDVKHLLVLASEKNVQVIEDLELGCQAVALLVSK
ncbi:MAG: tellurite-like stress resistance cysteine protease StiP [Candidatus Melainabacteria bacterium]|nr:tellurite-like stress resistance cysteine protease StiP [Candidatus Melainabacteria bacterium]